MRTIETHKVTGLNEAITLLGDRRDPAAGNMSHHYVAIIEDDNEVRSVDIDFQHGPIKEHGVNGLSNEVLYAILIDRLIGAQEGPYACSENESALRHTELALGALKTRTLGRLKRGVEGTSQV